MSERKRGENRAMRDYGGKRASAQDWRDGAAEGPLVQFHNTARIQPRYSRYSRYRKISVFRG